jgi:hypothetical protein
MIFAAAATSNLEALLLSFLNSCMIFAAAAFLWKSKDICCDSHFILNYLMLHFVVVDRYDAPAAAVT